MKKLLWCTLIFAIASLLLDPSARASGVKSFQWVQTAKNMDFDAGGDMVRDRRGNLYASGTFTGTTDFQSLHLASVGSMNAFFVKYSKDGTALWATRGGPVDPVTSLAVDSAGSLFAAGTFYGSTQFGATNLTSAGGGDIYLVKFDSNGTVLWARRAGGSGAEYLHHVCLDKNGAIYLAGSFSTTATFGSHSVFSVGGKDAFVAKYDAGGNNLWVRRFGGATDESVDFASVDNEGNYTVVGDFFGSLSFSQLSSQWQSQVSTTSATLLGVSFPAEDTGYAVGTGGVILTTTNGGAQWTSVASGTLNFLRDVFFTSVDAGVIVGESGLIIRTTNRGGAWQTKSSGTTEHLVHVHFLNASLGMASGQHGVLLKTTDGGDSWQPMSSGVTAELPGVFVIDETRACAVGFSGTILRTTDAGGSWTQVASPVTNDLRSVYFTDHNNGYAVSIGGIILKTTDAGVTWNPQSSGTTKNLYAVNFADPANGTAVGTNVILRTSNAGATWINQPISFTGDLYAVDFVDNPTGWAVGQQGKILHAATVDSTAVLSAGDRDIFLAKFDSAGAVLWSNRAGGTDFEYPYGASVAPSGDLYITGAFSGETVFGAQSMISSGMEDIFIARYSSGGTLLWANRAGGSDFEIGDDVVADENGSVYLTGFFVSPAQFDTITVTSNGGSDAFIAEYSSSGAIRSVKSYGGTGSENGLVVVPDPNGSLYVRGNFTGPVDFDAIHKNADPGFNMYLGKLSSAAQVPTPTSPANGDSSQASGVRIEWVPGLYAEYSHLQLGTDSSFLGGAVLDDSTITGASVVAESLTNHAVYYWRVRSRNSESVSSWSDVWRFSVSETTYTVSVTARWNIISLPLRVADPDPAVLFPGEMGTFAFTLNAYQAIAALSGRRGYWLNMPSDDTLAIAGNPNINDTLDVGAGWNLVGSGVQALSTEEIQSIPPGIITSRFFTYDRGYSIADSTLPFRGYWIKTSAPGKIIFSPGPAHVRGSARKADFRDATPMGTLTFRDSRGYEQSLYFDIDGKRPQESRELPPPGPDGFDVRYASNTFIESFSRAGASAGKQSVINIHSDDTPITVLWKNPYNDVQLSLSFDGTRQLLRGSGSFTLRNRSTSLTLSQGDVPASFSLRQNFPNPFNPTTTIAFAIPEPSVVQLKVYNLVGQEIATLIDGERQAGSYAIAFDGSACASGPYLYRIVCRSEVSSTTYVEHKFMTVLK